MEKLSIHIEKQLKPSALAMLQRQWLQLCAQLHLPQEQATQQWEQLQLQYQDPQRHYHNFSHLKHLLQLRARVNLPLPDVGVFDLALWLHDVVYEPLQWGNERASAEWAQQQWAAVLNSEQLQRLKRLILCTEKHQVQANNLEEHFFLDLDLSIFAARLSDYECYTAAIRQEYAAVPEAVYQKGRLRVLRAFVQRERLFFTEYFYTTYEAQARNNIEQEMQRLEKA